MCKFRGVTAWTTFWGFVLVCTSLGVANAEIGNLATTVDQAMPHPYVPPLDAPASGDRALFSRRMLLSVQPATESVSFAISQPTTSVSNPVVDMKALVLYRPGDADGVYNMITSYLKILGIPYATLDTSQAAPIGSIETDDLWDGINHGYYYAIFITTSNIWAALSPDEKTTLTNYERSFGVREATLYAYPNPVDYGLNFAAVTAANNDPVWCPGTAQGIPFNASLTATGQTTFAYLRPDISLSIEGACMYGYLAEPVAGANVTPLMVDTSGKTFLATYKPGDGRELIVMTEGSFYPAVPPGYLHAQTLTYGIINWATKGRFLGERHIYFMPQPDDVIGWGDRWDVATHQYLWDAAYRNTPADFDNLVAWKNAFRSIVPNAYSLRIEMPFNGEPVLLDQDAAGEIQPGSLTAKIMELQNEFVWLNHTYTHRDLDIDETPYPGLEISSNEISLNNLVAQRLGFTQFSQATLLTGDYSGISTPGPNPDFATAAFENGVRYLLVNASVPAYTNPSPNTGIPHPTQPEILQLPRYANNIFYAVTTPEEETDLYNIIYCPGYAANPYSTPQCFDYNYILASVTNQALRFMLDFSVNATMFHMNNFNNYGDGKTVMTDFIEGLYEKYNAIYASDVQVLSPTTEEIGRIMRERMDYNVAGITGQIGCGDEITLHANENANFSMTGVVYGDNVEIYGNQPITRLFLNGGETIVIPGTVVDPTPAAIKELSSTLSDGTTLTLNWPIINQDTDGNPINILTYRIYARANDPTFTPTPADLLAEQAGTSFTHTTGVADPTMTYTYVVTSIANNCSKKESGPSNYTGVNQVPVATPQVVTTTQGSSTMITLNGTDPDGHALTYRLVSNPSHGSVSAVGSGTVIAAVAEDTWLNRLSGTINYGAEATLMVSKAGAGMGDGEGLLRFDLPALPAGASVGSASMILNQVSGGTGVGSLAVQARQVTRAWNETTSTFATIPTYGAAAMGKTTVLTNLTGEYAWDLTSLVQTWYSGVSNFGVLLGDTASGTDAQLYATKESGPTAPRLAIHYTGATVPTLIYTPTPSYSGPDSFTFVANDGRVDSAPVTVTLNVTSVVASDLIFKDSFETGDFSAWSGSVTNGEALSVGPAAALLGSYGLQGAINNNAVMYLNDETPNVESRYRARFYFDPNSIQMVSGNTHYIFNGYSDTSTVVMRIQFRFYSGSYQIRAALMNSVGGWKNTAWFSISDEPHSIEFDWRAATSATATNGYLTLWLDGVQVANATGSANFIWNIDRVSLGTVTAVNPKTRGTYFFDAYESRKASYIGP